MSEKQPQASAHRAFEDLRHTDSQGNEFWSARQLAKVLDYSEYRHFQPVIERAQETCANSGQRVADHFEDYLELVDIGSGAQRKVRTIHFKSIKELEREQQKRLGKDST